MTKIIQLVGSLLGTVFGFGLGLLILERASGSISQANKPAFLVAIVVASLLFGYLAIPYITVRPARWAVDRLAQAGAGDFALGVGSIVIGLLMGVLAGIPLSSIGGTAGAVLPPTVAVARNSWAGKVVATKVTIMKISSARTRRNPKVMAAWLSRPREASRSSP